MPKIPFCLLLILLLATPPAFSQQSQVSHKNDKLETPARLSPMASVITRAPHDLYANLDVQQPFPARGGSVDWGLALSGGGIRSASFSVGVMKSLYEQGILDKVDVVSSVSGGGFASYWLLNSYALSNRAQKFGEAAFRNDSFIKNVCELQNTGNMFTTKAMLRSILRSDSRAFQDWEKAIRRFAHAKPVGPDQWEKITELQSEVARAHVPYYIFNVHLESKELNRFATFLELTPTYAGNPVLGFVNWEKAPQVLGLSQSVTMSSAGVKFKLASPFKNYAPHIWKAQNFELSDGGYSENLAALPLIRRGVKNIIIVDAEHDPFYEFGGYALLQELLGGMGIQLSIPDIDQFMVAQKGKSRKKRSVYSQSAVSVGTTTAAGTAFDGTSIISRIYYIKMSKPSSIILKDPDSDDRYKKGMELTAKRESLVRVGDAYDCNKALGFPLQSDMYRYIVNYYSQEMDSKRFKALLNKVLFAGLVSNFPHITTARQSFYRDQLEAFVGLGYLQASELKDEPE